MILAVNNNSTTKPSTLVTSNSATKLSSNNGNKLPQTGESATYFLNLAGLALIGAGF